MRHRLLATLALMLLGLVACGGNGGETKTKAAASTTSTTVNLASRVQTFPAPTRNHTQDPVTYPQTPPVGGDHFPVWVNCGFYSRPVRTESAVHSLEHGAVWITYRPNLPKDQIDVLRSLAHSHSYALVSPWADNTVPAPVVASAWGLQLKADSARDPALPAFIAAYASGPQAPERGAPCTGGVGSPE